MILFYDTVEIKPNLAGQFEPDCNYYLTFVLLHWNPNPPLSPSQQLPIST